MTWYPRPPPQQRRATALRKIAKERDCDAFSLLLQSVGMKRLLTALAQVSILTRFAQRCCLTLCRSETTLLIVIATQWPIGWQRQLLRFGRPPLRSDIR